MTSREEGEEVQSRRVRVRGIVQGVGFRDACAAEARTLGLAGWVRNRRDGSVELLLQGSGDAVQRMASWLHRGVPAARVDEVDVLPEPAPAERHQRFERRPTE